MQDVVDILYEIAEAHYLEHINLGYAPEGNNGPYQYDDTPVRNTCHWLIIYSYIYKKSGKYKDVIYKFCEYLINKTKQSKTGAIECMVGPHFDHLNGLIGQAWAIEAMVYAAEVLNEDKIYEAARKIFCAQKFDERESIWTRIEVNGEALGYDIVVNHQVWFAIAGCVLDEYKPDPEIMREVSQFLDRIAEKHFRTYGNGLIRHCLDLKTATVQRPLSWKIKRLIKRCLIPLHDKDPNRYDPLAQEKGYHLFELYGYAILNKYFPDHQLYKMKCFSQASKYGLRIEKLNKKLHINNLNSEADSSKINKYAYGYNSPAFEFPLIAAVFGNKDDLKKIPMLVQMQMEHFYNSSTHLFDRNNYDGQTLTARAYELVRYLDFLEGMNEEE